MRSDVPWYFYLMAAITVVGVAVAFGAAFVTELVEVVFDLITED